MKKLEVPTGSTIMWEEQDGNKWISKKHTFRNTSVNVHSVVKEMERQPQIRNITFTL